MELTIAIMCAGEGKRMKSNIPKVLHKFNNVPILVKIINECLDLEPKKILIITGKYDSLIKETLLEYLKEKYKKLIFVNQIVANGTGGAIKATLEYYDHNENILILNGDMPLIKSDLLKKFLNKFQNAKLMVSQLENPAGYGRIIYENNKFVGIKEEKDCNEIERKVDIVNTGIYLFNSNILKKYIPKINNINVQNEYYLTDIVKIIIEDTTIIIDTYLVDNKDKYQTYGVNTREELYNLEKKYK